MTAVQAASIWVALNIVFLVYISVRVGGVRTRLKIDLGDAGHPEMIRAVRAQGNYVEYAWAALLGLVLLAFAKAPVALVHALGAAFLFARIAHLLGLGMGVWKQGRFIGTLGTVLVLVATAVALLWFALAAPATIP